MATAKSKAWVKPITTIAVFFLGLVLVAILELVPWFGQLEYSMYDFVFRIRPRLPAPAEIVIVSIDESSIKEIGPRPWSRTVHARLLRKLKQEGARAAVFDILFDWPTEKAPEDDQDFARAISEFGTVILGKQLDITSDPQFSLQQTIEPLPIFYQAGASGGYVYMLYDLDTKIRKACWLVNGEPTLATAALLRVKGEKVHAEGDQIFLGSQKMPSQQVGGIPVYGINFAGPPHTIPTRSYYQVLGGTIPPGFLKDKIVFIGADLTAENSAAGSGIDRFPTPVDEETPMPGVEIHANALNTILTRSFVRIASTNVVWMLLILFAIIQSLYHSLLRPLAAGLATLAMAIASTVAFYLIFVQYNYWLPSVRPVALIALVYGGNTVMQYRLALRERAQIQRAFKHYVSAEVLGELMKNPDNLGLGGREVEATVLFTDIAGFSKISEKISPQDLTKMLNQCFELLATVIMKENGMVNKFMGDAIMAIWGVPLDNPQHAIQACRASLAMHRAMITMDPVKCRIGINTGKMIAGNMGSHERFEYTVIGDAVNLASRLEGVNKLYGTSILISEMTEERVRGQFLLRELDNLRVVGKATPVRIFELLDRIENRNSPQNQRWSEIVRSFLPALDKYRNREWECSAQLFERHLQLFPEDQVGRIYLNRCHGFIATPPPEDWDGVYQMETK
jgi:adenylate cyclase